MCNTVTGKLIITTQIPLDPAVISIFMVVAKSDLSTYVAADCLDFMIKNWAKGWHSNQLWPKTGEGKKPNLFEYILFDSRSTKTDYSHNEVLQLMKLCVNVSQQFI